jgi:hypothetical protein
MVALYTRIQGNKRRFSRLGEISLILAWIDAPERGIQRDKMLRYVEKVS